MKISKKILAIVLAAIMIFSVMPLSAFATEWTDEEVWGPELQAGDILTSNVQSVHGLEEYTMTLLAGGYGVEDSGAEYSDLVITTEWSIDRFEAPWGTFLMIIDFTDFNQYCPYNANGMTNQWYVVDVNHENQTITLSGCVPSTPTVNTYTATWMNYNGAVLKTDEEIEEGTTPTYFGKMPAKPSTDTYFYAFSGWNPAVEPIAEDTTYTATFTEMAKTSEIDGCETFVTKAFEDTRAFIGEHISATNSKVTATDTGWSANTNFRTTVEGRNGEKIVKLVLTRASSYGAAPVVYVNDTAVSGTLSGDVYTFDNLNATYVHIGTGSNVWFDFTDLVAYYKEANTYTVTWQNEDGTLLETDTDVAAGTTPTYDGETPIKADDEQYTYTFAGWTPEVTAVTGDVTYTAQFTPVAKFSVFVKKLTGGTITVSNVTGLTTVAQLKDLLVTETGVPASAMRLIFAGKQLADDKTLGEYNIQKESTLHLVIRTYTITWKSDENTVIDTTNVAYGETPTHADAAGYEDADYTYTFAGWTPEVTAVTGDATYTATYTATERDVLPTVTAVDSTAEGYDTAYEYTYANDGSAKYANYYGDITVSFDRAIEADDVVLAGAYDNFNGGAWNVVPLRALAANEEFRIVKEGLVGQPVTFAKLLAITGGDFRCAAKGTDVSGVTMTVKFNLYETKTSTEPIEIASSIKTYTFPVVNYVAEANGVKYESFDEALRAISTVNAKGQFLANGTLRLLADCAGNGYSIASGSNLIIDFNGKTYTVDAEPLAGSTGTKTQAFQLLKDSTVIFKNGTLYSEVAKMLVQNYSDLTLEGMTLTLENPNYYPSYTLSNNNGDTMIIDSTINANSKGGFAFDVCRYASYPSVSVTVSGDSEINGDVEIFASKGDPKEGLSLKLNGGTMSGDIVVDSTVAAIIENENVEVKKAAGFVKEAPEGFEWNEDGILVPAAEPVNGGSLTLTDGIAFNAYLDADAYGVDASEAVVKLTYNAKSDINDRQTQVITETKALSSVEKYVDETSPYNGTYKFVFSQAPAQMNEDIVIELYANADETGPVASITTSAAELCETVIATSNDAEYVALCKSLLDYGRAAQIYFEYDLANVAAAYNNDAVTTMTVAQMNKTIPAALNGVPFKGVSLTALSTTKWNILVNSAQNVTGITGIDGASASSDVLFGDNNAIVVSGINAADFAKAFTVSTSDGTVTLSAAMIARAIVKASSDSQYQNLARAFYLYGCQAESFFA